MACSLATVRLVDLVELELFDRTDGRSLREGVVEAFSRGDSSPAAISEDLLRVSRRFWREGKSAVDFQLNLNAETVARLEALPPICVEPGLTVRDVLQELQTRRRSTVLICREGMTGGHLHRARRAQADGRGRRIWTCRSSR